MAAGKWILTHGSGRDRLTREVHSLAEAHELLCQGWTIEGEQDKGGAASGKERGK